MRKLLIISGIFLIILIAGLVALPGYARKYIEKHDQEFIGRQIQLTELHLNYFKFTLELKGFVLFEKDETSAFVSFDRLFLNLNPWALFSSELELTELLIEKPYLQVIQDTESLNFDDLLASDTTEVVEEETDTSTFRYSFHNIQLQSGTILYHDVAYKTRLHLDDFGFNTPLISWDNQQSNLDLAFNLGNKGSVAIQTELDNQSGNFTVDLNIQDLDLKLFIEYLRDYLAMNDIQGFLDSQLKIKGNTAHPMDFEASGEAIAKSLNITDLASEDLVRAEEIKIGIHEFSYERSIYHFSHLDLNQAKIKARLDVEGMNLMRLMEPYFSAPVDSGDTSTTRYHIAQLNLNNGWLEFQDLTLNRPFIYTLENIQLSMQDFNESAREVPIHFSMNPLKKGTISGDIVYDWLKEENLSMKMKIENLGLISFSPYSEYFIASPITQGELDYDMSVALNPKMLKNDNTIRIDEMEFGKKTKDSTAIKAPVKLALYLLKDKDDRIKINLPVEGDPSAPKFSYKKLIWQFVSNFLVKTAASPFKALASLTGNDPEQLDHIDFEFLQDTLYKEQTRTLDDISTIMNKRKELKFQFSQFTNPAKEKEALSLSLAKEEYRRKMIQVADSQTDISSSKNKAMIDFGLPFLTYLKSKVANSDTLQLEELCYRIYPPSGLDKQLNQLLAERDELVRAYLTEVKKIPADRIEFLHPDFKNTPAELLYPHFKIEVEVD